MPAAAARTRRWLRPLRPGWKAVASSAAPIVRSGSLISAGGRPSTRASPRARPHQAEQGPHRRRLAGPVGAEEAGDPAGLDREGEVVDGDGLAVALGQVADLELGHAQTVPGVAVGGALRPPFLAFTADSSSSAVKPPTASPSRA